MNMRCKLCNLHWDESWYKEGDIVRLLNVPLCEKNPNAKPFIDSGAGGHIFEEVKTADVMMVSITFKVTNTITKEEQADYLTKSPDESDDRFLRRSAIVLEMLRHKVRA